MDRPLSELTGAQLIELHQQIKDQAAKRKGTNPANDKGANDEGISELDQHVLSNHSFGAHNVNATYISQHIDHLATCAAKIDAGITRRINATSQPRKRKQRHLRAVA